MGATNGGVRVGDYLTLARLRTELHKMAANVAYGISKQIVRRENAWKLQIQPALTRILLEPSRFKNLPVWSSLHYLKN